ncbi:beta-lactamase class C and other penicillin binding protein [Salinisphaera sp. PC39]|uniref:serine hydrolase domain-containing protein n=1 Tax=Salinisphaera sp. PC39 TaxID=1304156 RepID=UPI00334044BC
MSRVGRFGARLVDVPASLAPVTAIAPGEAAPGATDLTPRAVDAVWRAVEDLYRSGAYPGIAFCLRRDGVTVLDRTLGHARGNGPDDPHDAERVLMTPDTPVCLFSASKAVTAILVHKLAEEGGIDLDAPVARYLPEFAGRGKARTTIAEVLSHRGGFPLFQAPDDDAPTETLLDWDRCIELICGAPPTHRRAPRMAYHAITGGFVLAEVIRRVTGGEFTDYLDSRLRRPLGMRHFTFGLPEGERDAVARNYTAGQPVRFPLTLAVKRALGAPFEEVVDISNHDAFMRAVVPAGNLYATAEELSRFYQMLLDEGEYEGRQVLSPATVRRAVKPAVRLRFDHTLMIPMRYSEGLMLGANPFGLYGPLSARAYGHLGFMNILGWADPSRRLAASLLVTGKALLGGHLVALGELLTTIAWQCR